LGSKALARLPRQGKKSAIPPENPLETNLSTEKQGVKKRPEATFCFKRQNLLDKFLDNPFLRGYAKEDSNLM
jgi:hypothetical protein